MLRDELGLSNPHFGCGLAQCGACTVHVDGAPTRSCSLPVSAAAGTKVTTLAGLGTPEHPHPLQVAFIAEQVPQCGYCLNGWIMTAAALLRDTPIPRSSRSATGSPASNAVAGPIWPSCAPSGAREALVEAKRDATLLVLKEQEDAGIDIVTDGEQARQHFVHGFLENIKGIDFTRRVTMGIRNNRYNAEVPTVTGPLRRKQSVHGFEAEIARAHTRRRLKFTLPGPMTIVDTIADAHYGDKVALAMAFAALLNDEAHELAKIGVDVIQFDEPAFNVYVKEVTEWGIAALHRAAEGLFCKTAVHICYGYGLKANIDWKASLGAEWRQYEAIFPALATSRIDQVSVECAGAKVPIDLLGLLRGKEVVLGAITQLALTGWIGEGEGAISHERSSDEGSAVYYEWKDIGRGRDSL